MKDGGEEVSLQSILQNKTKRLANISVELLSELLQAKPLIKTSLLNLLSDKLESFSRTSARKEFHFEQPRISLLIYKYK